MYWKLTVHLLFYKDETNLIKSLTWLSHFSKYCFFLGVILFGEVRGGITPKLPRHSPPYLLLTTQRSVGQHKIKPIFCIAENSASWLGHALLSLNYVSAPVSSLRQPYCTHAHHVIFGKAIDNAKSPPVFVLTVDVNVESYFHHILMLYESWWVWICEINYIYIHYTVVDLNKCSSFRKLFCEICETIIVLTSVWPTWWLTLSVWLAAVSSM